MNQFNRFKIFQAFTILLAMTFVGIKSYEYHDKFTHYEVVLHDEIVLNDGKTIYGQLIEQNNTNVVFRQAGKNPGQYENPQNIAASQIQKVNPGKIADGHLEEKTKDHVVIHGHMMEKGAETAHAGAAKHEHTKISIETASIKKIENYGPWHNTYLAIYFTLTALHGLHVIGGAIVIGYLWGPGSKLWKTDPERFTNRIEVSGLFWHFVDLVWIFLFPVLYLL